MAVKKLQIGIKNVRVGKITSSPSHHASTVRGNPHVVVRKADGKIRTAGDLLKALDGMKLPLVDPAMEEDMLSRRGMTP